MSAAAQEQPASLGRPDTARVEVLKGRARLLTPEEGERFLSRSKPATVSGRVHVELPAGAQVRVSWLDRASLQLWGPAAIEWNARAQAPAQGQSPLPLVAPGELEWTILDLGWIDFEVRRGVHVLRMPGDWRAEVPRGAFQLRGLPHGPLELYHQAGQTLTLTWLGELGRARPPIFVRAGSRLRIDQPPPARTDHGGSARSWSQVEWPWRDEVDSPADRAERAELTRETNVYEGYPTLDRGAAGPVTSVKGFADPSEVAAQVEVVGGEPEQTAVDEVGAPPVPSPVEAPTPTPLSPITGKVAPPKPREETEPRLPNPPPVQEPDPEPAPRGEPYDAAQWRGLLRSELSDSGAVAVQKGRGVEVRVFPSGRYKVFVDALAKEGAWCFGPDRDYFLQPGAVAVFELDGRLKLRFGRIDESEPITGRPPFTALAR